jgi:hypothetical protein
MINLGISLCKQPDITLGFPTKNFYVFLISSICRSSSVFKEYWPIAGVERGTSSAAEPGGRVERAAEWIFDVKKFLALKIVKILNKVKGNLMNSCDFFEVHNIC